MAITTPRTDAPSDATHRLDAAGPATEERRGNDHDVVRSVTRHPWFVLLVTFAALGVALLVASRQVPVYESQARVLVTPIAETGAEPTASAPNMATEQELVSSAAVAELVATDLGLSDDPRSLLSGLSVERLSDTEILEVRYRDEDPVLARRLSQAFAQSYLEHRRETATLAASSSAEELDRQIETLRRRFRRLQRRLQGLPSGDPNVLVLRNEATVVQEQLLQRQFARLEIASAPLTPGEVIEPATLPRSPVAPNLPLVAGLGLFGGAALGIGSAVVRDRLSRRLRSAAEVEEALDAPVLAWVPEVGGWRGRKTPSAVSPERWRSREAEPYRGLRTSLLSAVAAEGTNTVVVTSPNHGNGTSVTVANLAVALARAGTNVVAVSADLRRPRLHQLLGVPGDDGLVDVLDGRLALEDALWTVKMGESRSRGAAPLRILPSGRSSESDNDRLTPTAFRRILADLEGRGDLVLIDAPPVLSVTDALVVASVATTVLLVVGPRSAKRSAVVSARRRVERVGGRILGVVLNGELFGDHDSFAP